MMTIGNLTGIKQGIQEYQGGGMQMDATSKNIQKQIANAQKQLQDLSSNDDMPLEEKMKKKQQIQQEITRLQQQLRQHQIEQRKQQSQKADEPVQQNQKQLKHANVQAGVATKMKDMANILEKKIEIGNEDNMDADQKMKQSGKTEPENAQDGTTPLPVAYKPVDISL